MNHPDFWSGRRVLITGHTGFKGSWLLLWLRKLGARVWGYSLPTQSVESLYPLIASCDLLSKDYYHIAGDIVDLPNLKHVVQAAQPQVVIHLAAQPLVRQSYEDPLHTWMVNVQGSLNLLESLKELNHVCSVVMVTTDKVYKNQEWIHGYREVDPLGGHDPYSASKAAAEIAINSWRSSFCGKKSHQSPYLKIASARAGNVIGGGDWATDRIVPDLIRALISDQFLTLRNPNSRRPWQHVLEPLSGYLRLSEVLHLTEPAPCEPFNFGPYLESNRTVLQLVNQLFASWNGNFIIESSSEIPHEAELLHLQIDKAFHCLNWHPRWDFTAATQRTVQWYKAVHDGADASSCCLSDISDFQAASDSK